MDDEGEDDDEKDEKEEEKAEEKAKAKVEEKPEEKAEVEEKPEEKVEEKAEEEEEEEEEADTTEKAVAPVIVTPTFTGLDTKNPQDAPKEDLSNVQEEDITILDGSPEPMDEFEDLGEVLKMDFDETL
jgi:hypothetical protein